jgi:hypothetical protein
MKRATEKPGSSIEKPAASRYKFGASELDRAIVEMRKGATMKATAARFGISVSRVDRAERLCEWHDKGATILAADPESLEGLGLVGEISRKLAQVLQYLCGHAEGLREDYIETYPRYRRTSEVLAAGEQAIRWRRGMGATLWAEWLAFMEARGLEWDEVKNPPAGPLPSGWNVVAFPQKGEELQRAKLTNTFIRERLKSLDSDWWGTWELLQQLPGGADAFGPHFGAVQCALDKVWNKLVQMRVIRDQPAT